MLAAHILGFPSCGLSGGVGWSTQLSGANNGTGTQLEGPGSPGFQTNVWWSLTRAGSCASSPVALRLLEPTQRRLAVGSGRPSRPSAAHFPRGPRGAQRPLGAAARPGRRPKCWQHLSLHIPRMFARARRARLRLETHYDFRSLTN